MIGQKGLGNQGEATYDIYNIVEGREWVMAQYAANADPISFSFHVPPIPASGVTVKRASLLSRFSRWQTVVGLIALERLLHWLGEIVDSVQSLRWWN